MASGSSGSEISCTDTLDPNKTVDRYLKMMPTLKEKLDKVTGLYANMISQQNEIHDGKACQLDTSEYCREVVDATRLLDEMQLLLTTIASWGDLNPDYFNPNRASSSGTPDGAQSKSEYNCLGMDVRLQLKMMVDVQEVLKRGFSRGKEQKQAEQKEQSKSDSTASTSTAHEHLTASADADENQQKNNAATETLVDEKKEEAGEMEQSKSECAALEAMDTDEDQQTSNTATETVVDVKMEEEEQEEEEEEEEEWEEVEEAEYNEEVEEADQMEQSRTGSAASSTISTTDITETSSTVTNTTETDEDFHRNIKTAVTLANVEEEPEEEERQAVDLAVNPTSVPVHSMETQPPTQPPPRSSSS